MKKRNAAVKHEKIIKSAFNMGTQRLLKTFAVVAIMVVSPAAAVSRAELFPFGRQVRDSTIPKYGEI